MGAKTGHKMGEGTIAEEINHRIVIILLPLHE